MNSGSLSFLSSKLLAQYNLIFPFALYHFETGKGKNKILNQCGVSEKTS